MYFCGLNCVTQLALPLPPFCGTNNNNNEYKFADSTHRNEDPAKMMRISALNEDTNSSSNEEHEPEVTREAQVGYFQRYLDSFRRARGRHNFR